jgi:hypothetical protein
VIVVSFVAGLALAGLALVPVRFPSRPVLWTAAGLNVLFVLALSLAVFGEDAYTQNGSNWANRTTQAHVIYLVVAGIGIASAVFFGVAAVRRRAAAARAVLVAIGLADVFMAFVVALAFLSN